MFWITYFQSPAVTFQQTFNSLSLTLIRRVKMKAQSRKRGLKKANSMIISETMAHWNMQNFDENYCIFLYWKSTVLQKTKWWNWWNNFKLGTIIKLGILFQVKESINLNKQNFSFWRGFGNMLSTFSFLLPPELKLKESEVVPLQCS